MRTRLVSVRWTLTAVVLSSFGHYLGSRAQNTSDCSTSSTLTVRDASSLEELYSYLEEAKNCENESSISVDWDGTFEINQTIVVPSGVELRVYGGGYIYGDTTVIDMNSSSGDDGDTADSVIRGDGNVRLFRVNKTGSLFISGMTLQNGWGGDHGGGIYALAGATIISDNCLWESLSSAEDGGAIDASSMANMTFRGTNIFFNCSSLTRGGAIHLDSTVLDVQGDMRFENCTTGEKGGAMYMKDESELRVAEGALLSFSSCSVSSESGDAGGGVYSEDSGITVGANAMISFENNSVPADGDGGGLYGDNTTVTVSMGANISFVNNYATDDGGGMYLEVDEESNAICLTLEEGANAEFFTNSVAGYGGGAQFSTGCNVTIAGDVHFEGNVGQRGGAMYMDESWVVITGRATFINNSAERWGGAVMVLDSDGGLEMNGPVIFQYNSAGRSGGAINLENTVLNVTSDENAVALWEGNSAGYDGGVIAVDGGEVYLQGGFASSNSADQRGGVLFATGESLLSWTAGESFDNSAASGGSLYISNSEVNITDVRLNGDQTPSGGVVFLAGADVRAVNVTIVAPDDLVGDFALHVDADSMIRAFSCSFEAWSGDYNLIVSEGQLVMDACDFSESSNTILFSSVEAATIRNAILGDKNYASVEYNASTVFGSDTNTCSTLPDEYACISNENGDDCVDADYGMGVLCAEYIVAATEEYVSLSRGSDSSVELITTSASTVADDVYYPDLVEEELVLRFSSSSSSGSQSSSEGEDLMEVATKGVLWELRSLNGSNGGTPNDNGFFNDVSADSFSWVATPLSGILMEGDEVTIRFVATPPPVEDPQRPSAVYNGEVFATFYVLSRTADTGSMMNSRAADLNATYYYCPAGEYWDGVECVLCVELMSDITDGEGSLECNMPGVTLETLPLSPGYWRGDVNNTIIQSCLLADACKGGRGISASSTLITTENYIEDSRYCETGYTGPYCAVCTGRYRRLSGHQCLNCEGDWDAGSLIAFWFMVALTPVLLISLLLFLLGGTTSFKQLGKKIARTCCRSKPAGVPHWGSEESLATAVAGKQQEEEERAARSRKMDKAKGFGALLLRAIPFQQLKILIVVWQILTQFSNMAEIPYPSTYKRFLSILDIFSFDISWPLSAMCIVEEIHFYEKLLIVTLGPIIVLGLLGLSYRGAMRWHRGTDRDSEENRRQAKVRHASTALLVLFLVFSSVSTTIFSTFSCHHVEDLDVWLLRADYSIACHGNDYMIYQAYAGVMIAVYPIGIPMLFAFLLLNRRDKINPLAATDPPRAIPLDRPARPSSERRRGITVSRAVPVTGFPISAASLAALRANGYGEEEEVKPVAVVGRESQGVRVQEASEGPDAPTRQEVLQQRAQDIDLQPTKFLWEPYEPRIYYYETVECGRRCLMTGALVFVLPNTAGQLAGACIFAFISLLGFELIRPHLCSTDAWMYRIGCIVIFFSNFLGLMAKTDVSAEDSDSQEMFGVLLVCVHATMFFAILVQSFLAVQAASESRDDVVDSLLDKTKSREIVVRRTTTFDSGDGTKVEAPRSPQHHGAFKSADIQPFEGDGVGTVASAPRIQQAQPFQRVSFPSEPKEGGRPHVSLAGRHTKGYQDLDALNARSDRMFDSGGTARGPTQALQLHSSPSARGEVVDDDSGKYLRDVFATAPVGSIDHLRLGRRTAVKRRGLLHRLKSNGTAGINGGIVPSGDYGGREDQ